MQAVRDTLILSASDVVAFLECEYLTLLDWSALRGEVPASDRSEQDESAALIARKGNEHERAYLDRLRAEGKVVVDIAADGGSTDDKVTRTIAAMRSGAEVIYQATLSDGPLFGHADFLRRVDGEPSVLGSWRYEVADTKLARSPKAKFLVQLAFYSQLLAVVQGAEPHQLTILELRNAQRS